MPTLDLSDLPSAEDERHEFKGGDTSDLDLATKLCRAASAFWNSGGGVLAVGIDSNGVPDHGIRLQVGRQSRRDWIDQMLSRVAPVGRYTVQIRRHIHEEDRGHVIVEFAESTAGPHMAPDNRYYVRGGAHTVPAGHFLVEAIRTRRMLLQPKLGARLRRKAEHFKHIELLVLALNDAPAVQVEIDIQNPERFHADHAILRENFPLRIGVVDRAHPFTMDYDILPYLDTPRVGEAAPKLEMKYRDLAGNIYEDEYPLEVLRSIGTMQIGDPPIERLVQELKSMNSHLATLVAIAGNPS